MIWTNAGTSLQHLFDGVSEASPAKVLSVAFLVTAVTQLALDPASCPARADCTAVFPLPKGKFSRLRVTSLSYPPYVSS